MWKYFLLFLILIGSVSAQEDTQYWTDVEYLLWFIKDNPNPTALVTDGSYQDALPGAIGQPHTHTVLGKRSIDMGWMQGFQANAGWWIKPNMGIEGTYFLLPTVSTSKSLRTSGEPGSPNYAVPIFDVSGVFGLNGIAGETIFILPGPFIDDPGFSATYTLKLKSQLQGAALNYVYRMIKKSGLQLECAGGGRWLQLREMLLFKARSHAAPGSTFDHAFYNSTDQFKTRNDFIAAQFEIDASYRIKKWHLKAILDGMLGAMLQRVRIHGHSQTSDGNLFFLTKGTSEEVLPGGVFAQPSNSGTHKRNPLVWGVEAKIRIGFEMTKNIEMGLGYTFLWISKVVRPGNQIDRKINSTRTALADASRATVGVGPGPISFGSPPGPAPAAHDAHRPKVLFKTAAFWAQGLDAGIQFNF